MQLDHGLQSWLLSFENPPVRYLTLVHLLRRTPDSPEVREARGGRMEYSVTRQILDHFDEILSDRHAYRKYRGLYWQLIFLGWFGAAGSEARIARWVEEVLSERHWIFRSGGQCLTANVLAALCRLGYREHPMVVSEIHNLARRVVDEGGIECDVMGESLLVQCYMAQPKLLLCFAEMPPEERCPVVGQAIEVLVRRLLDSQVFRYVPGNRKAWQQRLAGKPRATELPPGQTVKAWVRRERELFLEKQGAGTPEPKPAWMKFGFPLHYGSDVLEALYALARVGVKRCPEVEPALELVRSKRTPRGQWVMESSLNGKMWADVEVKGQPSRWLTFFALFVLDHFRPQV